MAIAKRQVLKFQLGFTDGCRCVGQWLPFRVPRGGRVILVAERYGILSVWVEAGSGRPSEDVEFFVALAEGPVPSEPGITHVGSTAGGQYPWHVYAKGIGR